MTLTRSLLLLSVLGACTPRSGGAPAIEPVARPVVAVADVPGVVDVPAVADAAATDEEPALSPAAAANERLLRGLADGSIPLATSVDPALGLVLVSYIEATPNGGRERHSSQRLCGAAIARDTRLRQRLRELITQAHEMDVEHPCDDDACSAPGMEYQATLRARFAVRPDGTRVLVGFVEVSEAALGEDWMVRAGAYTGQEFTRARSTPCR